eukprot:5900642-Ditylum_brightwellii.AAC.1
MKDYIGNTARSMINWAQQAAGISTPDDGYNNYAMTYAKSTVLCSSMIHGHTQQHENTMDTSWI